MYRNKTKMEASASSQFICTVLSFSVILLCIVLKIPQILTVYRSKSCKGLNLNSVILEQCGYSIMLAYQFAKEYPLSSYFEYTFLVLQDRQWAIIFPPVKPTRAAATVGSPPEKGQNDLVLLLLMLEYSNRLRMKVIPFFIVYFIVYSMLGYRLLPDIMLPIAASLNIPLSSSSKILQLRTIYINKDAGQVSALTWALTSYATIARCITTILQTGDRTILASFSLAAVLNISMVFMVLYYKKDKKKLY